MRSLLPSPRRLTTGRAWGRRNRRYRRVGSYAACHIPLPSPPVMQVVSRSVGRFVSTRVISSACSGAPDACQQLSARRHRTDAD